jgi:hypothetical protein
MALNTAINPNISFGNNVTCKFGTASYNIKESPSCRGIFFLALLILNFVGKHKKYKYN